MTVKVNAQSSRRGFSIATANARPLASHSRIRTITQFEGCFIKSIQRNLMLCSCFLTRDRCLDEDTLLAKQRQEYSQAAWRAGISACKRDRKQECKKRID